MYTIASLFTFSPSSDHLQINPACSNWYNEFQWKSQQEPPACRLLPGRQVQTSVAEDNALEIPRSFKQIEPSCLISCSIFWGTWWILKHCRCCLVSHCMREDRQSRIVKSYSICVLYDRKLGKLNHVRVKFCMCWLCSRERPVEKPLRIRYEAERLGLECASNMFCPCEPEPANQ